MDWNQLILYSNQLELEEGKGREEKRREQQHNAASQSFILFY